MATERLGDKEPIEILLSQHTIGFDGDGVLMLSHMPVVDAFNRRYKTAYRVQDLHTWFAVTEWAKKLGLEDKAARELDIDLWTNPEILIQAPPVPGAYKLFKRIHDLGFRPPVITTRIPELKECTLRWFASQMAFTGLDQLHIRLDHSEAGETFKARVIRELGLDIFIDDAVNSVETVLRETNATVILVPTPGNQAMPDHPRLVKFSLDDDWPSMETIARNLNDLEFLVSHNLIDTFYL